MFNLIKKVIPTIMFLTIAPFAVGSEGGDEYEELSYGIEEEVCLANITFVLYKNTLNLVTAMTEDGTPYIPYCEVYKDGREEYIDVKYID